MSSGLMEPRTLGERRLTPTADGAALVPRDSLLRRLVQRVVTAAAHPGVWSVADQGLVSGTSFITGIVIARCCSRSELGLFALSISLIALARAIQEQLVGAPYMVFAGRMRGRSLARYTGSCLVHQVQLTLAAVLAFGGLWLATWSTGSWDEMQPLFPMLVMAVPFLLFREHVRQTSYGLLRPGAAIAVDAIASTLQLGIMAALWWTNQLTIPAVFVAMTVGCGVGVCAWLSATSRLWETRRNRIVLHWHRNWRLGRWALACQLVGQASPYLMPWLIASTHDVAATGLLAACTTLAGPANLFVSGYANHLTPRASAAFATGGVARLRPIVLGAMQLFAVTLGLYSAAAWCLGDAIVDLVYGDKFTGTGAGQILAILATVVLINSFGTVAGNALWAMERAAANFRADVATLLATLVAAICFVPLYGALGSALATLVGGITGSAWRVTTLFAEYRRELVRDGIEGGDPCHRPA